MKEVSGKKFIERNLYRMAIVARMGIDDGEFTQEEITELIATKGSEVFNRVLGMSDMEFTLLKLKELATLLEKERRERT